MSPNYLLYMSAQGGLPNEMDRAIADGANINTADLFGIPVLHKACMGGNVRCIYLSIEAGADIEAEDSTGLTAVQICMQENRPASAIVMLDSGADGSGLWNNGRNLLHWCVIQGFDWLIERSVRQGANINGLSRSGHTPIGLAAEQGKVACVKTLLDCGANPLHLKNICLTAEIAQLVSAFRARSLA